MLVGVVISTWIVKHNNGRKARTEIIEIHPDLGCGVKFLDRMRQSRIEMDFIRLRLCVWLFGTVSRRMAIHRRVSVLTFTSFRQTRRGDYRVLL